MPDSPDDILNAMRSAGEEFARMADTIEGKLPKIVGEFKRLPAQLRPLMRSIEKIAARASSVRLDRLVNDLGDADKGAAKFLVTLDGVEKKINDIADAGQRASESMAFARPAAASLKAVQALTSQVNQLGQQLGARTRDFQNLSRSADKLARSDLTDAAGPAGIADRAGLELPDNRDARMLGEAMGDMAPAAADVRAELGGADEEALALRRSAASLRDDFHEVSAALSPVQQHFHGMEEAIKGLSGYIVRARGDLSDMEPPAIEAWAAGAKGQIESIIEASQSFPGLEPIGTEALEALRAAMASLEDGAMTADEMRETMAAVGREMEDLKARGRGLNKALLADVEKLADETKDWYGVSKRDQSELLKWRVRHQKAAERMIERGMKPAVAYAKQLAAAMKDVPIEGLQKEIQGVTGLLKQGLAEITQTDDFSLVGIAKGAIKLHDRFADIREEMAGITAEAGHLSSMWSAGAGADDVTEELERLHYSMDNLMDTWGMTKKETTEATGALLKAGFSMSSILGPSLKDAEGGMLQLAKGGEYAMSGMDELGRLSRMTGRSLGDIATMAGQWREQMGVTIGEVGETYLELEGHARRSGLAVGKFMDRLMASAGGFVIFGGRIEDVAATLSDLMAGMKLPPGLAEKIAGDYMERLRKTTMEEAMLTTAMLGEKGRDAALAGYKKFVEERGVAMEGVERTIKALEAKKAAGEIDEAAYSKLRGEAENRRKKLQEEMGKLDALVKRAEAGDAASLAALQQYVARQGDMAAVYADLVGKANQIGGAVADAVRDAVEAGKEPQEVMQAMKDGMSQMAKTGQGMLHLQNRVNDLGFENEAELFALVQGTMDRGRMLAEYARMSGREGKAIADLVKAGASMEEVSAAIQESARTPAEMLKRLQKLQAQGFSIPEAVTKKLEEAKEKFIEFDGDPEKQAKLQQEAAMASAKLLAGVVDKPKPVEEELRDYASQQMSIQEKIKAHLEDLMKWGKAVLIALGIITALMRARSAVDAIGSIGGKKGVLGLVKNLFSRSGPVGKILGKIPGAGRIGGLVGRTASAGGRAARGLTSWLGKAAQGLKGLSTSATAAGRAARFAGRAMGPLAVGVTAITEAYGIYKKEADAYNDAYKKALSQGKTKAEAEEIAQRAKDRAVTKADAGGAVGAVAGAGTGAIIGGIIGVLGGPIGVAAGAAIGGWLGGEGGKWLGEKIGDAFTTEAERFNAKMEQVIDLGTLDDARALVAAEEKARDDLQAQKMALIAKEEAGERLTAEEREKLRDLQRQIVEKEKQIELAKHAEWVKEQEELQGKVKEGMTAENRLRLDAIKKKRELERKKSRGEKLSAAEEQDLLTATNLAKADPSVLKGYLAGQEKRSLRQQAAGIEKRAEGIGLTEADKKKLADIQARIDALDSADFTKKEPSKDILQVAGGGVAFLSPGDVVTQAKSLAKVIGGGAGELVRGMAPGPMAGPFADQSKRIDENAIYQRNYEAGMSADAKARLATIRAKRAAREGGEATAGKAVVDNSTWNVYINSQAEKELEEAFLKVLIKHQQRLVN